MLHRKCGGCWTSWGAAYHTAQEGQPLSNHLPGHGEDKKLPPERIAAMCWFFISHWPFPFVLPLCPDWIHCDVLPCLKPCSVSGRVLHPWELNEAPPWNPMKRLCPFFLHRSWLKSPTSWNPMARVSPAWALRTSFKDVSGKVTALCHLLLPWQGKAQGHWDSWRACPVLQVLHSWQHTGSARTAPTAQANRGAKQEPRERPWCSMCRTGEACRPTNLGLCQEPTLGRAERTTEGDPWEVGLLARAVNRSDNFHYQNHIIKCLSDTQPDFLFTSWCFPSSDRALSHYLSMLQ